MDMGDRLWGEADALVQTSIDAELREEAYEVFVAEASRCRMTDRCGDVAATLRCGVTVKGRMLPEWMDGHLAMRTDAGAELLVPTAAVVVILGGAPSLRREGEIAATIGSALRESWSGGRTIRVLLADGAWRQGEVDFVGADHVTLRIVDMLVTIPMVAVEAWQLG